MRNFKIKSKFKFFTLNQTKFIVFLIYLLFTIFYFLQKYWIDKFSKIQYLYDYLKLGLYLIKWQK